MLCIEISSEHVEFMVVGCNCSDDHIVVYSDSDCFIDIDSDCNCGIDVHSELYDGICVDAQHEDFIEIWSYIHDLMDIWSELYEGLDVSATLDDFINIDSESNDFIDVSSESTGNIEVSSYCDIRLFGLSSFGLFGIDVYSSYVCRITKDGYLYLLEMYNEEPVMIFVNPEYEIDVNVFSNLNWFVD